MCITDCLATGSMFGNLSGAINILSTIFTATYASLNSGKDISETRLVSDFCLASLSSTSLFALDIKSYITTGIFISTMRATVAFVFSLEFGSIDVALFVKPSCMVLHNSARSFLIVISSFVIPSTLYSTFPSTIFSFIVDLVSFPAASISCLIIVFSTGVSSLLFSAPGFISISVLTISSLSTLPSAL